MEILTINLTATGPTKVSQYRKAGSYFEVLESSGAIDVRFSSVNGAQINSIKGGLSGLFLNADFGGFDIENQYGADQAIKVLVCDAGEDGGSRRQPGIVQVVDTAKATTTAGGAYSGSISAAPGAAQYGTTMLWNPVGSGKRLIVESAYLNAGATAISATFGLVTVTQGASGGTMPNHLANGPASIAQMYAKSDHAVDPNALMTAGTLWGVYANSNSQPMWTPKRPIVLLPGSGLLCACRTANVSHSSQYDYYEEAL